MKIIPKWSGCFTPANLRLNGIILTLAAGLTVMPLPSMSSISGSTNGRIQGRAPEVTGTPVILLPDGTTLGANNAEVNWFAALSDLTLAPVDSYGTYMDADGDAPLGTGSITASAGGETWEWTHAGGTPLNGNELIQPFKDNFADGTVLKVTASVAVDVASISGMPNTEQRTLHSGTHDVVVKKPPTAVIRVGGTNFTTDSGFPRTGFVGANYQYYMNGINASANAKYTYEVDQSWVTVNASGQVAFVARPDAASKSYTVTIKNTALPAENYQYVATLEEWFVGVSGAAGVPEAKDGCDTVSGRNIQISDIYVKGAAGTRGGGVGYPLFAEWGPLYMYGRNASIAVNGVFWWYVTDVMSELVGTVAEQDSRKSRIWTQADDTWTLYLQGALPIVGLDGVPVVPDNQPRPNGRLCVLDL